ncbi:hypothetical protein TNCV_4992511 [Trichonephila clavipes]|nr:hypothetical protein TNCV_4992511 [Trichonephila clavipes]
MHDAIRSGIEVYKFCMIYSDISIYICCNLALVRLNSWDAQLIVPNDPRYARLEINMGITKAKEELRQSSESLVKPCRMRPSLVLLKNGSWEPLQEWKHMWLQDVMDIPLGCHGATDQY